VKVLEAGDWSLLLPPEWIAERDDESIIIADRDEVGCLELSELRKERGLFDESDIHSLTDDESLHWTPVSCGSFSGLQGTLTEEGAAIREWYIYAADLLLYVTYSCELENRGMDDAAVDDILGTLSVDPDRVAPAA
jgi:hypothetical protein